MSSIPLDVLLQVELSPPLLEDVVVCREYLVSALFVVAYLVDSRSEFAWVLPVVMEGVSSPEAVSDH